MSRSRRSLHNVIAIVQVILLASQAAAETRINTHSVSSRPVAEPIGPPVRIQDDFATEKTGITLFNAYDQGLLDEWTVKTYFRTLFHQVDPSLLPGQLEAIGNDAWDIYRIDNTLFDMQAASEEARKAARLMAAGALLKNKQMVSTEAAKGLVESLAKGGSSFAEWFTTASPRLNRVKFQLVDESGRKVPEWSSPEIQAQIAQLTVDALNNPVVRKSNERDFKKVNHGSGSQDPIAAIRTKNREASDSESLRTIRETLGERTESGSDKHTAMGMLRNLSQMQSHSNAALALLLADKLQADKEKELKRKLAPGRTAVAMASMLFPNSDEVKASAIIASASMDITEATGGFRGDFQLDLANISNIAGIVMGAISKLFSLGSKSSTELILDQLAALQKQVRAVHSSVLKMHSDMADRLNYIEYQLALEFDLLRRMLSGEFADLKDRIRHLEGKSLRIAQQIHQSDYNRLMEGQTKYDDDIKLHCETLECKGFDPSRKQGEPGLTEFEVHELCKAYQRLGNHATDTCYNKINIGHPLASGSPTDDKTLQLLNQAIGDLLAINQSSTRTAPHLDWMHLLGVKIPRTDGNLPSQLKKPILPNIERLEMPILPLLDSAEKLSHSDFGGVFNKIGNKGGELTDVAHDLDSVAQTLHSFVNPDIQGRPHAESLLTLLENYKKQVACIDTTIQGDFQRYFSKNGDGFDPQKPIDQQSAKFTDLTRSELFPEGAITACSDYRSNVLDSDEDSSFTRHQLKLPVSQDEKNQEEFSAKWLNLIPVEFRVAAKLNLGKIEVCFDEIDGADYQRDLSEQGEAGAFNLDDNWKGRPAITIKAVFRPSQSRTARGVPIFRRRVTVDGELQPWKKVDYNPVFQRGNEIRAHLRDKPVEDLNRDFPISNPELWNSISKKNHEVAEYLSRNFEKAPLAAPSKWEFRGMNIVGELMLEGFRNRIKTVSTWATGSDFPLEGKLLNEGLNLMTQAEMDGARLLIASEITQSVFQPALKGWYEGIHADVQEGTNPIGDCLRAIAGAEMGLKKAARDFYLSGATETDPTLQYLLSNIKGESEITADILQNFNAYTDGKKRPLRVSHLASSADRLAEYLTSPTTNLNGKIHHDEVTSLLSKTRTVQKKLYGNMEQPDETNTEKWAAKRLESQYFNDLYYYLKHSPYRPEISEFEVKNLLSTASTNSAHLRAAYAHQLVDALRSADPQDKFEVVASPNNPLPNFYEGGLGRTTKERVESLSQMLANLSGRQVKVSLPDDRNPDTKPFVWSEDQQKKLVNRIVGSNKTAPLEIGKEYLKEGHEKALAIKRSEEIRFAQTANASLAQTQVQDTAELYRQVARFDALMETSGFVAASTGHSNLAGEVGLLETDSANMKVASDEDLAKLNSLPLESVSEREDLVRKIDQRKVALAKAAKSAEEKYSQFASLPMPILQIQQVYRNPDKAEGGARR